MMYEEEAEPTKSARTGRVPSPDPGGAIPEPPGPRARLLRLGFAWALVAAGLTFLVVEIVRVLQYPIVGATPLGIVGRLLGLVVLPLIVVGLGVLLLRGNDEPTHVVRRSARRRGAGPGR